MTRIRRDIKIVEIERGIFEARLTVGYSVNGRQKRKKVRGRTKSEVRRKIDDLRQRLDEGSYVDSSMTLNTFVEQWKGSTLALEDIRSNTRDDYIWQADHYVLPYLGRRRLIELTPQVIEEWQADLLANGGRDQQGLSPATVRFARATLTKALGTATAHGHLHRNPVPLAKGPRRARRPGMALTGEAVQMLIDGSDGWLRLAIIIGARTGLRPGEVVALRWENINFSAGYLSVTGTSHAVPGGGVEIREPKTAQSRRLVPIEADLETVMLKWQKVQNATTPSEFVVTIEGRPVRRDSFTQSFARLAKRCGIKSSPHGLRHTFATSMVENGHPTAHVAEILGDSEQTVTTVYSHVLRPKVELRGAIGEALPLNLD